MLHNYDDIPVLEMIVTVLFISSIVSLAALSIELRTVDIDAKAPRLNIVFVLEEREVSRADDDFVT